MDRQETCKTLKSVISDKATRANRYWGVAIPVLGMILGGYLWEFLNTNLDFTGPQNLNPASGLLLTLLVGPSLLLCLWGLSGAILARRFGLSWAEGLKRDAPSYLPVGLLALSPIAYLVSGHHTPAYQAAVIVLVSLVVSAVVTLKAWTVHDIQGGAVGLPERWCQRFVWAAIALFVVVCGTLFVLRYNAYNVWGGDLGLVDQALWNTLHGRFMQFTHYSGGGVQMSLFAFHFEVIFLLFLPLYIVWPDPRALLIAQAALVALGAWPLYRLARQRLGSPFAATCLALTYLVFPSVVSAGLDSSNSVRTDTLALPILLFALYYLERRNTGRFLLAVLLALACKETVALVVALLGLYILYRQRNVWLGVATLGLGVLWFVAVVWGVIPYLRHGEQFLYYEQLYGHIGGKEGLAGILQTMLADPGHVLRLLFNRSTLLLLFFLAFSAGLLPLLDPITLAIAAPIFGVSFLMLGNQPINLGDHHFFMALPFFFLAGIGGINWLQKQLTRWLDGPGDGDARSLRRRLTTSAAIFLLTSGFLGSLFWSPGPLSWNFWSSGRPYTYWRDLYVADEHDHRTDRFVTMVPEEEPVIVSDYVKSRLTHRERIYTFFGPPSDAVVSQVNYALVDLFEIHIRNEEMGAREMELFRWLLQDFNLTAFEDGLLYLERYGQNGFHTAVDVVATAEPQHRLDASFGDRVRLLGYDLTPSPSELRRGQRYRIVYYWQVLEGFDRPFALQHAVNPDSTERLDTNWVLIDTFSQGKVQFRVIHLPTYILLPPARWQPGQIVQEVYEFVLPEDLPAGEYAWQVGLYAVPSWFAIETAPGRLVPGTEALHLARTKVW